MAKELGEEPQGEPKKPKPFENRLTHTFGENGEKHISMKDIPVSNWSQKVDPNKDHVTPISNPMTPTDKRFPISV